MKFTRPAIPAHPCTPLQRFSDSMQRPERCLELPASAPLDVPPPFRVTGTMLPWIRMETFGRFLIRITT